MPNVFGRTFTHWVDTLSLGLLSFHRCSTHTTAGWTPPFLDIPGVRF